MPNVHIDKDRKCHLNPTTLGERWGQWAINSSRSPFNFYVFLGIGIALILFYFLSMPNEEQLLYLGALNLIVGLIHFERYMMYRLVSRHLLSLQSGESPKGTGNSPT